MYRLLIVKRYEWYTQGFSLGKSKRTLFQHYIVYSILAVIIVLLIRLDEGNDSLMRFRWWKDAGTSNFLCCNPTLSFAKLTRELFKGTYCSSIRNDPAPKSDGSQLPATPIPGNLTLSSGLHEHLCVFGTHTNALPHTNFKKNISMLMMFMILRWATFIAALASVTQRPQVGHRNFLKITV